MALAAPSIDTAKLVNIFYVAKYFDKNFQNISILFFLVRKKFFPALGGYFFSFCGRVAWHACHLENQKSKVEREKNLIIYNIYKINICFTVAMTRISKIAMTRVPRHAKTCHNVCA